MWLNILLIVCFLQQIVHSAIDCNIEKPKKCENLISINSDEPSIFIAHAQGRLGNHLMAFAIILALAKTLNIKPYVQGETAEYLKKYFVSENIPVFEETFCNHEELKPVLFNGDLDYLVKEKKLHTGKLLILWPWGYKVCYLLG